MRLALASSVPHLYWACGFREPPILTTFPKLGLHLPRKPCWFDGHQGDAGVFAKNPRYHLHIAPIFHLSSSFSLSFPIVAAILE